MLTTPTGETIRKIPVRENPEANLIAIGRLQSLVFARLTMNGFGTVGDGKWDATGSMGH